MATMISRYLTSERGNIAMLSALAMPVLIGAAGLGVEAAFWRHSDLELQQAADKAVFAAAMEKRAGSASEKIKTEATCGCDGEWIYARHADDPLSSNLW